MMHARNRLRSGFCAVLIVASSVASWRAVDAQTPATDQQPETTGPGGVLRPKASVPKPVAAENAGRIRLDVVVADAAAKPLPGLTKQDFALLDNERPQTLSSFQAADGAGEQPIEIVLVIDLVNAGADDVAATRTQLDKYLRQNSGHLANPVLMVLFSADGLQVQSQPSSDGNGLAKAVDEVKATPAGEGADQFDQSLQVLTAVSDIELKRPGRKVLIWTGKGWPVPKADDPNTSMGQNDAGIGALVGLTNKLREARIVLFGGDPAFHRDPNQGMTNLQKLDPVALSLGAIALRTGGHGLSLKDLAGEINRAVSGMTPYYTLSFEPPADDKPDEYHAIKLNVNQPKVTVRTTAGYYSEPPPPPAMQ
jgi:VWFA-related protein